MRNESVAESNATVKRTPSVSVILDFVPTSCSVHINQTDDDSIPPAIDMEMRLANHKNLATAEGKYLKKDLWGITIYRGPTDNERIKELAAIGLLGYYPDTKDEDFSIEEGCSAWAHLDSASFDLLQSFVTSGRMPSGLRIHAKGKRIRHGRAPDGSEVVWDVSTEATGSTDSDDWVAVNQLELTLAEVGCSEDAEPIEDRLRPVSAADLYDFQQAITANLESHVSSIKRWLSWLLEAAVAIAIIVLISTWGK